MSPIEAAEAFERAPLLAERVGEGGDADVIIARARAILSTLADTDRVAVLNTHPRIGATVGLSSRSAAEQRAGEAVDHATLEALARLNDEYERRFGFRCVIFVNGRSRAELVPVIEARLRNGRDAELATGLEEFLAIARDRLRRA